MTVELAERPGLQSSNTTGSNAKPSTFEDARPEAFAATQALSLSFPAANLHTSDPFDAVTAAQPSDRGYEDYWLDPLEP